MAATNIHYAAAVLDITVGENICYGAMFGAARKKAEAWALNTEKRGGKLEGTASRTQRGLGRRKG
jgi:hypothetical protein